jgi:NADPH-dependent 2,4-dienoyl-CoA reductase/sulfur reductase-like enzyme
VVGAGFSGLEIAEKLLELNKKVHLIVRSRLMRRLLENKMSDELESRLPRSLEVHKGKSPSAVLGDTRVTGLAINDYEIRTDAVIFMTGVNPKVELAKKMGLEIGDLGGIVVDLKMQTSEEDVFAVGDCIEMADFYTGIPVMMPIGSVAARCGRQAGVIAVGGQKVYEDTDLRFQYDRIFNTDIVCVGHSSEIASRVGVDVDVHFVTHPAEQMEIAVVTAKNGQVLGGQVISSRLGAKTAYQILQRMQEGTTLEDNPLLDPLHDRILSSMQHRHGPIG